MSALNIILTTKKNVMLLQKHRSSITEDNIFFQQLCATIGMLLQQNIVSAASYYCFF